ncbi:ABC transporter substrate-binding protein [uncultured Parolsenella sp.]|uniref:ABC transporter substrate-binding protein n=1 Tax=uncultured Parolsenella sp. TaxID=2083008 RepID=UPI0025D0DF51|nr:ABC transporter substrate-binding protein [uncultured Parolsenella sp.]
MNKNMSRREFVATAGLFAGMMGLVGCGGSGSAATTAAASSAAADAGLGLVTDGKLTVGTSPDFPPFENLENDQYVGLDIDLAQALADKLGLELEMKTLQFDAIVPAVAAGGQVDLGISGITIDPEREEQVDFSDSYYIDDLSVVAMKANADITADTFADALNQAGVTIAVQSGTTAESYAQENFPNATTQPYGNATDAFAAMQAGQANAVITNKAVGAKMVSESYTDAQVIKEIATGEEYGVAVSKDNSALLDAVNDALAAITDDGTLDSIVNKYFG